MKSKPNTMSMDISGGAREELGGAVATPLITIAPGQHPQEMLGFFIFIF